MLMTLIPNLSFDTFELQIKFFLLRSSSRDGSR